MPCVGEGCLLMSGPVQESKSADDAELWEF